VRAVASRTLIRYGVGISRVTFPDGHSLRFASDIVSISDRWRSLFWVRNAVTSVRVESGRVGDSARVGEELGEEPAVVTESASVKDGRIEVVERRDVGSSHFRWEGQHSEVMAWMPGLGHKLDVFAKALSEFRIVDSQYRVTVKGIPGLGHRIGHSVSANHLEDVGFLAFYPGQRPSPRRSVRVRSGDMWRQREGEHEDIILASEHGVLEISLKGATDAMKDEAAGFMEDLSIQAA